MEDLIELIKSQTNSSDMTLEEQIDEFNSHDDSDEIIMDLIKKKNMNV